MDPYFSLSLQQDVYNALELALEDKPSFPPENIKMEDCNRRLSGEDVDNAIQIYLAYLGMGCEPASSTKMCEMLMRNYLLDRDFRSWIDNMVLTYNITASQSGHGIEIEGELAANT